MLGIAGPVTGLWRMAGKKHGSSSPAKCYGEKLNKVGTMLSPCHAVRRLVDISCGYLRDWKGPSTSLSLFHLGIFRHHRNGCVRLWLRELNQQRKLKVDGAQESHVLSHEIYIISKTSNLMCPLKLQLVHPIRGQKSVHVDFFVTWVLHSLSWWLSMYWQVQNRST